MLNAVRERLAGGAPCFVRVNGKADQDSEKSEELRAGEGSVGKRPVQEKLQLGREL